MKQQQRAYADIYRKDIGHVHIKGTKKMKTINESPTDES